MESIVVSVDMTTMSIAERKAYIKSISTDGRGHGWKHHVFEPMGLQGPLERGWRREIEDTGCYQGKPLTILMTQDVPQPDATKQADPLSLSLMHQCPHCGKHFVPDEYTMA